MPPTSQHLAAEQAFRELLEENGLPPPEEVSYEESGVLFLWHETKLAVVIELGDEPRSRGCPGRARARASPVRG
jgi:hypothetical protein